MEKEGAIIQSQDEKIIDNITIESLGNVEGKKCKAPHTHQWGDTVFHNAMICSVFEDEKVIKVRVLFTNPTHPEMLPCPYYYQSDCKFSEEKCRFSHGQVVPYSSLQEYTEPKFEHLSIGSPVLAKQENNLWSRAVIKKLYDDKCAVRFECNQKIVEVLLEHVFPLDNSNEGSNRDNEDEIELDYSESEDREDIINMSLLISPSNDILGGWEQYTKVIVI